MNTIVFGSGENLENQYARCLIYATTQGYNVKGTYNNMPNVIERIAKRDIELALLDSTIKAEYSDFDLEILSGTFARYGVRVEIIGQGS